VFTPSSQNLINIRITSLLKTLTVGDKLHGVASGNSATNIPTAVLTPGVGYKCKGFTERVRKIIVVQLVKTLHYSSFPHQILSLSV
jgi:hypothetical protein